MARMTQQTDRFENRENENWLKNPSDRVFFFFNQPLESSAHFQQKNTSNLKKTKKKDFWGLFFFFHRVHQQLHSWWPWWSCFSIKKKNRRPCIFPSTGGSLAMPKLLCRSIVFSCEYPGLLPYLPSIYYGFWYVFCWLLKFFDEVNVWWKKNRMKCGIHLRGLTKNCEWTWPGWVKTWPFQWLVKWPPTFGDTSRSL